MDSIQTKEGITDSQIDQLLHYSKTDPEIKKYTSDPSRFKNKSLAESFLKNCLRVYTMVNSAGNLLGIVWFEKKPLPKQDFNQPLNEANYPLTFAIRIYGEARGKGLAQKFMEEAFEGLGNQGVWLITSHDNLAGVKAYQKFGFKQISQPDERGKIIMVFKNPPEF